MGNLKEIYVPDVRVREGTVLVQPVRFPNRVYTLSFGTFTAVACHDLGVGVSKLCVTE